MPGVQEAYSINVSNRYELSIFGQDEDESDSAVELDPIDTLRKLEEQQKLELESKKKAALKSKNPKKTSHFKENKDANKTVAPAKNEDSGKDIKTREAGNNKTQKRQNVNSGGDENRRPPRRRQDNRKPPREGGFGENVGPGLTGNSESTQNRYTGNRGDGDRRPERIRGGGGGRGFRGNNRGNRFGGYRNDGRDDRGKREFDRRSGSDRTSVKATEKRDGGGPHNWGTPEIEEATDNVQGLDDDLEKSPIKKESNENGENENGAEEAKEDSKSEDEKEKEPVEMTLDEWKALQSASSKPTSEFKVRRAGEGENQDQWKGMKLLHKSRKNEKSTEENVKENVKQHNKQPTIPVNIRFGDNAMRQGGRGGGRGRGAGRRGGGPRQFGNRDTFRSNHQAPPDVENEKEFPTLG